MEGSPVDIVIFAPLGPIITVLLFWFIQLLFIESEKYFLLKIKQKHEALYRFSNFLGIFFQNISHTLGYTLTKSGISEFYLSTNYGKVAPKKEKKGISEWISNGFLFVGPFFIPALLIFISLFFLLKNGLEISIPGQFLNSKYTFIGQINIFSTSLYGFANSYFSFLANIDLLNPIHIGFLILMLFLAMGLRPSYIGEPNQKKVNIYSDLKNIYNLITFKPLYLILLMSLLYIFFYISLYLNQNWYIGLLVILGWLSVVSIISILVANLILWLLYLNDNIFGKLRFLPFIILLLSYSLIRVFFFYLPHKNTNMISLFVTGLSTTIVTIFLYKTKTNKYKTNVGIKSLEKGKKGEARNK